MKTIIHIDKVAIEMTHSEYACVVAAIKRHAKFSVTAKNIIDSNKFPDFKIKEASDKITLWMEGYAATGEYEPAQCLGTFFAIDFNDAVKQYAERSKVKVDFNRFGEGRHAVWAREIFDNEEQAKKSFG